MTANRRVNDTTSAEHDGAPAREQLGRSHTRTDAADKVTGEAAYTMDMYPEDVLHARLVTSTEPHARLRDVDTAAAEELDGVVAVATAADAPDTRFGEFVRDQRVFASGKVRYVGEPIAVVAAETEAIAERATELVAVEYDPLPSVTDLEAAGARDPPAVVHEHVREYETVDGGAHVEGAARERPNLLTTAIAESGDLEAAFSAADHVFEREYTINPLQHCTMEPHVAVARADGDDVTFWTSHQIPHVVKEEIADLFELPPENVVVKTPFAGGAFGGKERPVVEPRVLAVARQTDRPVRLALTRHQQYTSAPSRPELRVRIKDGVSEEGDLLARDLTADISVGGYNEEVYNIANSVPTSVLGSYDVAAVRRRANGVYTNRPPYGAFRGFGLPEVNFAAERHMDRVAAELGLDPLEYRAQNLLEAGDQNALGETLHPCENRAVLRAPIERLGEVDVEADYPDYCGEEWTVGIGHAYGNKAVPQGETEVRLDVAPSGDLTARVGAPDVGQGSNTVVAQMVAKAFDTAVERVDVVAGDTDKTERDFQGPSGSRFTPYTGNALRVAAARLREELARLAAPRFGESDPDALQVADGSVVDPRTGKEVPFADILDGERAVESELFEDGVLSVLGRYEYHEEDHIYWVPVAQAAIVACNTLTGEVNVLRIVTAADVGTAINPAAVEQQLEGGTGQAIGGALYEEIVYDDGRVRNGTFKDYAVPKSTDLPYDSETVVFESVDTEGPFGAKSVGEVALFPTAAAIADAVEDALGIECTELPMTPERVLDQHLDT